MKASFYLLIFLFFGSTIAQNPEKIWTKAVPATEMTAEELPEFPSYKSMNSGVLIPATEDAVRGFFIRRLNMRAGNFEKKTIVKLVVKFVVDAKGKVTATPMESEYEAYITEGARVAKMLSTMTPATRKGKPVAVRYDFPLIFVARPMPKITKAKETLSEKAKDVLILE